MNNQLLLMLGVFAVTQLVNITHVDGLYGDFSNMVLEVVTANGSGAATYQIIYMAEGEWVLVNVSVPEGNYTLNVLSRADIPVEPPDADAPIIEISHQPGFAPDFSNLEVVYEENGVSETINFSVVGVQRGEWIIIALARAPRETESVTILASQTSSENVLGPQGDTGGDTPENETAPLQNGTTETSGMPPGETPQYVLEAYDSGGNLINASTEVKANKGNGRYSVSLSPQKMKVREILFDDLDISVPVLIGIDDVPEDIPSPGGDQWLQVYAVDPSSANFTAGTLSAVAKGNALYKCRGWEFGARKCNGGWELVRDDLIPGQEYAITLAPEDPAWGEKNVTVINVHSTPAAGGTWTIHFDTGGRAPLIVRAFNGTTWDDADTDVDLNFLELRCGDTLLDPNWDDDAKQMVYPNYECNESGSLTAAVLTAGPHSLEFKFGPSTDYAYNNATNVSNCTTINTNGTYQLIASVVGAPINASPINGSACIKITASNVIFDCNGFNITHNGTPANTYGIALTSTFPIGSIRNVTVRNCTVSGYGTGIFLRRVNESTFQNNIAQNSSTNGLTLFQGFNNSLLGNTARNNTNNGYNVVMSSENNLTNNSAYQNSLSGFYIQNNSYNNNLANNSAYNNSKKGFSIFLSNYNNMTGNSAFNNSETGFYLSSSTGCIFANNSGNWNGPGGFYAFNSTNTSFDNNTANLNGDPVNPYDGKGFMIESCDTTTLRNNTARDNMLNDDVSTGVYILRSNNTALIGNMFANQSGGIEISYSNDTSLSGNTAYMQDYNLFVSASNRTAVSGDRYFNSSISDASFYSDAAGNVLNISNVIFDNPVGAPYQNFTNISINHSSPGNSTYLFLNWSSNQSAIPPAIKSFGQKYLTISNIYGPSYTIDAITWHWRDDELSGVNEAGLEVWKHNSSAWSDTGCTLSAATNSISLANHNSSSVYGILEDTLLNCPLITTPGTYLMPNNYSGAPNSILFPAGNACVVISASDVVFDCAGYNITNNGTGNTTYGILLNGSLTNVTVRNCPGISAYSFGLFVRQSNNSRIENVSAFSNAQNGMSLISSINITVSGSVFRNNTANGIGLSGGGDHTIADNTAYGNADGIAAGNGSANALYANNSVYNNSLNGIRISNGPGNTLLNNTAYGNLRDGILLNASSSASILANAAYGNNNSGINIFNCTGANVSGNDAYGNNASGILLNMTNLSHVRNNTGRQNLQNGIYLYQSQANTIDANLAYNNTNGIRLFNISSLNNLSGNTVHSNSITGLAVITASTSNIILNTTSHGNLQNGITIGTAPLNAIYGAHLYNNSKDFLVNATSFNPLPFTMAEAIFDNPLGDYQNFTNLSINDSVEGTSAYTMGFAANESALPAGQASFGGRFVNITGYVAGISIDQLVWHWTDSESASYSESGFALWKYNSTNNWTLLNNTPDESANSLSLFNHSPASTYGILQYNVSNCPIITANGTYGMTQNFTGAPNNASPLSGFACVKINASNVVFDCNGFSITHNGTPADTYGIALSEVRNVTVRNCTISGYGTGIFLRRVNESTFQNNLAQNSSTNGMTLFQGFNNSLLGNTARNNTNNGYNVVMSSENNLTNNSAYQNSLGGFYIQNNSYNNNLANNSAYNNSKKGFSLFLSSQNNITGSSAYNNTESGFYLNSSGSNRLSGNLAYGNNISGFHLSNSSSNAITDNGAYNNSLFGFDLSTSSINLVTNNSAFSNAMDGFELYLSDYNTLINNSAYNHPADGFLISASSNNSLANNSAFNNSLHGFCLHTSPNNTLSNNSAYLNSGSGILLNSTNSSLLEDNTAHGNAQNGILLQVSSNNALDGNTAHSNTFNGIRLFNQSHTNRLANCTARQNGLTGIAAVANSNANNFTNISSYGNNLTGITLGSAYGNAIYGAHLYNNTRDFLANATTASPMPFTMAYAVFDNPLGDYQNFTNLSANDTVEGNSAYTINWSMNGPAPPLPPFASKFVNITGFAAGISIDSLAWHWTDGEAANYSESGFELWKFNSTWTMLNSTPDTFGNTLRLFNHSPASVYGILQGLTDCPIITSPGEYAQGNNYIGAPNNASPLANRACVKIAASDVVFDCRGYNITGNSSFGTTYGILLNGSLSNVTVKNCMGVSNYTYGITSYQSTGSTFANNSAFNNSYGIYMYNASGNNLSNNNITNNSVDGLKMDDGSASTLLNSNFVCFNTLDINNANSTNAGAADRCDSFLNWSENGHLGCEMSCTSFWHRFFGGVDGTMVLTDANTSGYVYQWNASSFNVYFTDVDAAIDWYSLQAVGRDTSNATSSNDFTELDAAFNATSFADGINATYAVDGSLPKETGNFTVYGRPIQYVPLANSTAGNTTFRTGILWDASDGGSEYGSAYNQSTVWMVQVDANASDVYGSYDYLVQVPYTLSGSEGSNDLITVYLELQ